MNWIFQGNPTLYDLEAALAALPEICWRVPQYTEQISAGDGVVQWKSGKDAGIVGLGRVASTPALRPVPEVESQFVLAPDAEGKSETRVAVRTRSVAHVAKARLAADPALAELQIVKAPMGTVFPLSDDDWERLCELVGVAPPEVDLGALTAGWPAPFSWKDRRKDTYPLPGGYDGYFDSLRQILEIVELQRPTLDELTEALRTRFDSSQTNARMIGQFLRRIGLVLESGARQTVSPIAADFLKTQDPVPVVALLHARTRFIGELLHSLDTPKSSAEVLAYANERFGMGWTTKAQIQRRRGWLQSAGLIEMDDEGLLNRTRSGTALVQRLSVHTPQEAHEPMGRQEPKVLEVFEEAESPESLRPSDGVDELVERLTVTSTASSSPDDFEFAIRDAFDFLGFRAEKLGGSGKTDVVADADLGRGAMYRLIVDGKTTGRGAVTDSQIDWDTIDEHRRIHDADFAAIVAPDFASQRVIDRAARHGVVLLTAAELGSLVQQHDATPLGLDAYRALFDSEGGEVDLDALADAVDAQARSLELTAKILSEIDEHVGEVGEMSSRDLFLLLRSHPDLDAEEDEIETLLRALATPLLRVLVEGEGGYRPAGPRRTALGQLRVLGEVLNSTLDASS